MEEKKRVLVCVGSGGVGTTSHIIGEVFQSATGVKMVHVPYKGGIRSTLDLVAGQIQLLKRMAKSMTSA